MAFDQAVALSVAFEVIDGFHKRNFCDLSQNCGNSAAEFRVSVNAGTNGGATHGKFQHGFHRSFGSINGKLKLPSKPAKFLTQAKRRGVCQVSSTDLDDLGPRFGMFLQDLDQTPQRRRPSSGRRL